MIGCVKDGRALIKMAMDLKPDLVLVDVGMPLVEWAGRRARIEEVDASGETDLPYHESRPSRGKRSITDRRLGIFAEGSQREKNSLQAVHNVARGSSYITPQISHAIEQNFIRDPKSLSRPRHLSDRQREVLQMLAEGRTMKEIAYILQIAHRTVRFHKSQIMEELGITTNSELVQYAIKHSIIPAP